MRRTATRPTARTSRRTRSNEIGEGLRGRGRGDIAPTVGAGSPRPLPGTMVPVGDASPRRSVADHPAKTNGTIMPGFVWLAMWQAQEALQHGRLEEALRRLNQPHVQDRRASRAGGLLAFAGSRRRPPGRLPPQPPRHARQDVAGLVRPGQAVLQGVKVCRFPLLGQQRALPGLPGIHFLRQSLREFLQSVGAGLDVLQRCHMLPFPAGT